MAFAVCPSGSLSSRIVSTSFQTLGGSLAFRALVAFAVQARKAYATPRQVSLSVAPNYGGPLLPYAKGYEMPRQIWHIMDETKDEEHASSITAEMLFFTKHRCVAAFVRDVRRAVDVPAAILDAQRFVSKAYFNEQTELPRHVEFPPSTVGGPNPYARLPEERWFDRLYC